MNSKLKILLLQKDIYRSQGGGQTVYQKIIQKSPNIDFFYFIYNEKKSDPRPKNAHPILLKDFQISSENYYNIKSFHYQATLANTLAESVKNRAFDIVEMADYDCFGKYIRSALEKKNVTYKKIVLSLHGNISDSLRFSNYNYQTSEFDRNALKFLELCHFQTSDIKYGISPKYIDYWKKIYESEIDYFDPIQFSSIDLNLTINEAAKINSVKNIKPNLLSVGRLEARKGHENFLDIVSYLNPKVYLNVNIIGEDQFLNGKIKASTALREIGKKRSIQNLNCLGSISQKELEKKFRENSYTIIPAKYDTFNLVALDSLLSGCPTAIAEEAGISYYLDKYYPNIPYIKLSKNYFKDIYKINESLKKYELEKINLLSSLKDIKLVETDFNKYYLNIVNNKKQTYECLSIENEIHQHFYVPILSKNTQIIKTKNNILKIFSYLKKIFFFKKIFFYKEILKNKKLYKNNLFFNLALHIRFNSFSRLRNLKNQKYINLNKSNIFFQYYKFNKMSNNFIKSLIYFIRFLRFSENFKFNSQKEDLNYFLNLNKNLRFDIDINALKLLYFSDNQSIKNYLAEREIKFKTLTYNENLIIQRDNRFKKNPKVSIIVSIYNSGKKIENFLKLIVNQKYSMNIEDFEIILINSNSPIKEVEYYDKFNNECSLNSIFLKSKERETIQKTWNRGIKISRGKYLVFLGIDETLQGDTLKTLSNYLDENPKIDWVMGNSLKLNIDDKDGIKLKDGIFYNRNSNLKNLTFLETCYVSWVGGMYRKDIHNKYGFYDDSFNVAGDTEFKSRILKYLNVGFIDKTLGIFLDYKDERKSETPIAEVEDVRAWYLFRTVAGIEYNFGNLSEEEIINFFKKNFVYRKSFKNTLNVDFYFFYNFVKFYNKKYKYKNNEFLKIEHLLKEINIFYNKLNNFRFHSIFLIPFYYMKIQYLIKKILKLIGKKDIKVNIFYDNLYEQHNNIW